MSRFYDCIAQRKTFVKVLPPILHPPFLRATIVQIDNVVDFWVHNDAMPISYTDYPNISPPFGAAFFEWGSIWHKYNISRCGVLLMADDISRLDNKDLPSFSLDEYTFLPKWIVMAAFFRELTNSGAIEMLPVPYTYLVDKIGKFCFRSNGTWLTGAKVGLYGQPVSESLCQEMSGDAWLFLSPCLLAQSFLHCKNVQRVTHEPPAKLNKARLRKDKEPLTKYYTLEIDPMKKVLREEGQIETNGLKKALHICRGHFANYTDGKGLFGKYHGQFWMPQHVRGSASQGIIEKDYSIKAPVAG